MAKPLPPNPTPLLVARPLKIYRFFCGFPKEHGISILYLHANTIKILLLDGCSLDVAHMQVLPRRFTERTNALNGSIIKDNLKTLIISANCYSTRAHCLLCYHLIEEPCEWSLFNSKFLTFKTFVTNAHLKKDI